jgi:hypothetical protein
VSPLARVDGVVTFGKAPLRASSDWPRKPAAAQCLTTRDRLDIGYRSITRMPLKLLFKLMTSRRARRAVSRFLDNPFLTWAPPGHYYSPIPDIATLRQRRRVLFDRSRAQLPGIDMNESGQLALIEGFAEYYRDLPFPRTKTEPFRYYFENSQFSYADAIGLYCMIRHQRPRRIVEVGSGFSSVLMLDTNERFFDGSISLTIVDPLPRNLLSLLKDGDRNACRLVEKPLEEADIDKIAPLAEGDILFVDSSHIVKIGSDVHYLMTEMIPGLPSGVLVHFHDVFWPFEYPEQWVFEGRAWNEDYFLRAFLQFNASFQIVLFNHYIGLFHQDALRRCLPLSLDSIGGSLWIKRVS